MSGAFVVAYHSSLDDEQVWPATHVLEQSTSDEVRSQIHAFEALLAEQRTEQQADTILRVAGILPPVIIEGK